MLVFAGACSAATPSAETSLIVWQVPFVDGERYVYELIDIEGVAFGSGELVTRFEGSRVVLEQRYEGIPSNGRAAATDVTELAVDATTLAPFGALREVTEEGDDGLPDRELYEWAYRSGEENDLLGVTRTADDKQDENELRLRENYYDNESSLWLWRTLDFDEALDLNYVSVNPIERKQQTVNIQTPARETIDVPAGSFEVWRVIVRNGRAIRSAWINTEAPYQLIQWDNGDVIFRADLVRDSECGRRLTTPETASSGRLRRFLQRDQFISERAIEAPGDGEAFVQHCRINRRTVRCEEVAQFPAALVSQSFVGQQQHGVRREHTQPIGGLGVAGLASFRCVDAEDADGEGFAIDGLDVKRVAVDDVAHLDRYGTGWRWRSDGH